MKTHFKFLTFLAAACILIGASCKKNKSSDEEQPAVANGTLYIHVHTDIDTTEVDSAMVAADASGRRFELDVAQFYISDIKLKKADGSTVSVGSGCILKNIATEEYLVGSVPAGNYQSISFNVGVGSADNQTMPSSHPASDPLSAQNPSMWFGSTSQGYMFVNVQGKADTTAAHNGPANFAFSYQLGTSTMLKTVTMPNQAFTVASNQSQLVHLVADYGKLLNGVDFKAQPSATPFANASVATQIANNIQGMFHYE